MLWWADLPAHVGVRNSVDLFRVEYTTMNYDGANVIASGLVAFPRRGPLRGVVSYQHGTRTNRKNAPSTPSPDEGLLGAAVFAGGGYLFTAPDYIGLGTSKTLHPYLHAPSTAAATVDLLRAARTLAEAKGKAWPGKIYLTGFSEGGYATAVAHRAMEAKPAPDYSLVASAPISPALNLDGIAFPYAIKNNRSLYLAYICTAYSAIYRQPLDSIVRPPFGNQLPTIFDGDHDEDAVDAVLPKQPRDLFTPEFLAAYDAGQPTWLMTALAENEAYKWAPNAPMRIYFGTKDTDVSPEDSQRGAEEMKRRGGDATAVCAGDVDHIGTVMHAIPEVRRWFDTLSAKK